MLQLPREVWDPGPKIVADAKSSGLKVQHRVRPTCEREIGVVETQESAQIQLNLLIHPKAQIASIGPLSDRTLPLSLAPTPPFQVLKPAVKTTPLVP